MKNTNNSLVVFPILTALMLTKFIPLLFPESRLWAVNHLIFLPKELTIVMAAISAMALLTFFVKPLTDKLLQFVDIFDRAFFSGNRILLNRLILIIIAGLFFAFFPASTHFLGDGYTFLSNMAGETTVIYKWTETGSTVVLSFIQSLFGERDITSAKRAFQLVAILSGIFSILLYFSIAQLITNNKMARLLAFFVLLFSGSLLLFFGYIEHYPILWPFVLGFIYFGLKYRSGRHGLWIALIFWIIGMVFHLQLIILAPAFLYLLLSRGKGQQFYQKFKWLIRGLISVGSIVVLYLFYQKFKVDLYFENIFLPPFEGKPIDPDYYIFGFRHLLDIINQYWLLSPLLILLVWLADFRWQNIKANQYLKFLTIMASMSFLFILIIDPKLGMPRDWDLFSLMPLGLTLLLLSILDIRKLKKIKRGLPAVIIYLIIAPLPFLFTVLNQERSIVYHDYIIDLDPKKSHSSIITLRDYYKARDDRDKIIPYNKKYQRYLPNQYKLFRAFTAYEKGDINGAKEIFKTIEQDRFDSQYHYMHGLLLNHSKKHRTALRAVNNAISLQRYNIPLYAEKAVTYIHLHQYQKAKETMLLGMEIDSEYDTILEGLAYVFLKLDKPDSALIFTRKYSELHPEKTTGKYMLAKIYIKLNMYEQARDVIDNYLIAAKDSVYYQVRSIELKNLLENIDQ